MLTNPNGSWTRPCSGHVQMLSLGRLQEYGRRLLTAIGETLHFHINSQSTVSHSQETKRKAVTALTLKPCYKNRFCRANNYLILAILCLIEQAAVYENNVS